MDFGAGDAGAVTRGLANFAIPRAGASAITGTTEEIAGTGLAVVITATTVPTLLGATAVGFAITGCVAVLGMVFPAVPTLLEASTAGLTTGGCVAVLMTCIPTVGAFGPD